MYSRWVSGTARAVFVLTSPLALTAACSALFGSDFDGYTERNGTSHAGSGGRDASSAMEGETGGRASPTGGNGGTASGGSVAGNGTGSTSSHTGGDASVDRATLGQPDHIVTDAPRETGSGGQTTVNAHDGGTGGGAVSSPETGVPEVGTRPDAPPDVVVPPRPRPPYGTKWPYNSQTSGASVSICYTTGPHVEWDGTQACKDQTSANVSCSGSAFDGTSADAVRSAFEALLQDTWARAANVEFWPDVCPNADTRALNPLYVAVSFEDAAPLTDAVTGIGVHNTPGNTFGGDLHVDWKGLVNRDPDALRKILRETGQILGLPYEWLRGTTTQENNEAPNACPAGHVRQQVPSWSPNLWGLYDFYSVMDRCTPTSLITRPGLSPGDAAAIQKLYGTLPQGALVGYRAGCAGSENVADGAAVVSFPCWSVDFQNWARPSTSTWPAFQTTVSGTPRCIGVDGDAVSQSAFTPVLSEVCNQSVGQKFELKNVAWKAEGNMCVTVTGGQFPRLDVAFCNGKPAQQWNFFDVDPATAPTWDMIQYAPTGQCVTMKTPGGVQKEEAMLATCAPGDSRQHFAYLGNGFISYGNGWCLDVIGGEPIEGESIGLWGGCNDPTVFNSQFFLSGNFKALDQCLSMQPMAGYFGKLGVEPCAAGNPNQIWDYHF